MRRSRSGHTLWEMLLVLALLGVLTAIVAPSRGLRAPARDDGLAIATSDITSLLTRARLTALERGVSVDVLIDPATARVWTFSTGSGERRLITAGRVPLPSGTMLAAELPRVRFTFDATGGGSGGPVVVRGIDGAREVAVDPWTGVAHAADR